MWYYISFANEQEMVGAMFLELENPGPREFEKIGEGLIEKHFSGQEITSIMFSGPFKHTDKYVPPEYKGRMLTPKEIEFLDAYIGATLDVEKGEVD